MLEFKNVSTGYSSDLVLQEISACLQTGVVTALIGPNGAGKSSLIRVASGILAPRSGRVTLDGTDLHQYSVETRAKRISVIPQARSLPGAFSVREVVSMGRTAYTGWLGAFSKTDEEIIGQAMERSDVSRLADRRVGELSGGEAQRVLVARALAQQAGIMLLDEPTTHLDFHYQVEILDLLQSLAVNEGLTVLAAIHDLNLVARYADEVWLLVAGRLEQQGNPKQVLTEPVLAHAYQLEMSVLPLPGRDFPAILPGK
jgi:iron complex transport system ATP-binding protein